MDIDEIIKLSKTINEKNCSIKELTKEKDRDWKDLKVKYSLNDAKTKKLMSMDSVEKYKIFANSFDPRTRNDWLEMDIDEIIKLTKTINEKNLSIKELIEDKDKDWKNLKDIFFLDDAKTKKLMSVDSVGKYKIFANSRYFYGGPIEILTTAELHNINFCIVNANVGTFETYLSKTNSDDYAFMHYQDLHFRPYYKNIGEDRRYTFKRREVSETILSLFSTTEVAENYYVNLENEFNNIKT
jgi:hypothetical protein